MSAAGGASTELRRFHSEGGEATPSVFACGAVDPPARRRFPDDPLRAAAGRSRTGKGVCAGVLDVGDTRREVEAVELILPELLREVRRIATIPAWHRTTRCAASGICSASTISPRGLR